MDDRVKHQGDIAQLIEQAAERAAELAVERAQQAFERALAQKPMIPRLAFSPEGLAHAGSVGKTSVYAAMAAGTLKSTKKGRRRIILAEDGLRWLKLQE
jgi:hypothetical protein